LHKIKKQQVLEILESLGLLLDTHKSSAELVRIKGNKVTLRSEGQCADCDTNCIEQAFREKIPLAEVIFDNQIQQ
jgi:ribosome-interacting GTPase 1